MSNETEYYHGSKRDVERNGVLLRKVYQREKERDANSWRHFAETDSRRHFTEPKQDIHVRRTGFSGGSMRGNSPGEQKWNGMRKIDTSGGKAVSRRRKHSSRRNFDFQSSNIVQHVRVAEFDMVGASPRYSRLSPAV